MESIFRTSFDSRRREEAKAGAFAYAEEGRGKGWSLCLRRGAQRLEPSLTTEEDYDDEKMALRTVRLELSVERYQ
jgi:hypothetical protein